MNVFKRACSWPVFKVMSLMLIMPTFSYAGTQIDNDSTVLSLEAAISIAQTQDNWLEKSHLEQARLLALSEGANTLPDPTVSIGLLNLPTDGFALNQEAMTQLKIGASQLFPKGDTLALQQTQLRETANQQPIMREDRLQKVALQTTQLWLDAYVSQASYALVKDAEPLFDKLVEIVNAGYVSSVGQASQQDLIRAELELVRLQDRLITLSTQQRTALARLNQFLAMPSQSYSQQFQLPQFESVGALPSNPITLTNTHFKDLLSLQIVDEQTLYGLVNNHPRVIAIAQQINAEEIGVEIAEQGYKPQFGVSASYALRDDLPESQGGHSRADFLSIGVSMSLPLFSTKRQDAQVVSSIHKVEITKTEKLLLIKELMAGLQSSLQQYHGATKRLAMYQDQILPHMSQQSEAALKAYTNDLGDFAEVVRAKIAELDAQITTIEIEVAQRKAIAAIQYYLASHEPEIDSSLDVSFTSNLTSESRSF